MTDLGLIDVLEGVGIDRDGQWLCAGPGAVEVWHSSKNAAIADAKVRAHKTGARIFIDGDTLNHTKEQSDG